MRTLANTKANRSSVKRNRIRIESKSLPLSVDNIEKNWSLGSWRVQAYLSGFRIVEERVGIGLGSKR